eukprot:Clim_evm85s149 gene=Clim_evmTU85s149
MKIRGKTVLADAAIGIAPDRPGSAKSFASAVSDTDDRNVDSEDCMDLNRYVQDLDEDIQSTWKHIEDFQNKQKSGPSGVFSKADADETAHKPGHSRQSGIGLWHMLAINNALKDAPRTFEKDVDKKSKQDEAEDPILRRSSSHKASMTKESTEKWTFGLSKERRNILSGAAKEFRRGEFSGSNPSLCNKLGSNLSLADSLLEFKHRTTHSVESSDDQPKIGRTRAFQRIQNSYGNDNRSTSSRDDILSTLTVSMNNISIGDLLEPELDTTEEPVVESRWMESGLKVEPFKLTTSVQLLLAADIESGTESCIDSVDSETVVEEESSSCPEQLEVTLKAAEVGPPNRESELSLDISDDLMTNSDVRSMLSHYIISTDDVSSQSSSSSSALGLNSEQSTNSTPTRRRSMRDPIVGKDKKGDQKKTSLVQSLVDLKASLLLKAGRSRNDLNGNQHVSDDNVYTRKTVAEVQGKSPREKSPREKSPRERSPRKVTESHRTSPDQEGKASADLQVPETGVMRSNMKTSVTRKLSLSGRRRKSSYENCDSLRSTPTAITKLKLKEFTENVVKVEEGDLQNLHETTVLADNVLYAKDPKGELQPIGCSSEGLLRLAFHAMGNSTDFHFEVLFMTFRHAVSPVDLLGSLRVLLEEETEEIVRKRIFSFVMDWVDTMFCDFYESRQMLQQLDAFLQSCASHEYLEPLVEDVVIIAMGQENRLQHVLSTMDQTQRKAMYLNTDALLALKADLLASQITLVEQQHFQEVKPEDVMIKLWCGKSAIWNATRIEYDRYVEWFNTLSNWVSFELVRETSMEKRVRLYEHFIKVARACHHDYRNYNSTFAILTALDHGSVSRIVDKSQLSRHGLKDFEQLKALMNPIRNHQNYRTELRNASLPCVPFMGLFVKDLVFLNELPKKLENGMINFFKMKTITQKALTIQLYQSKVHNIVEDRTVYPLIRSIQSVSENDLWEQSYSILPKRGRKANKILGL